MTTLHKRWEVGTLEYGSRQLCTLFFWLLWGDFAWSLKERSVPPVIQVLLGHYGASDLLTGLLIGSLPAAMTILVGPVVSCRSDRHRGRFGRRIPFLLLPTPLAVLSMIGLAFCPAIGGAVHGMLGPWSPGPGPVILCFFALFWALFELASTTANAVFGGLINDVVPQPVLGRFYGAFRALSLVAAILFTYGFMGYAESHASVIFLGVAALYGVGFTVMCLRVREGSYPPPPPREPGARTLSGMAAYFRECFGKPYYLWFFAAMGLGFVSFFPVNLYSVYFAKSVGMSMGLYGKCLALTYVISLLLAYILGILSDRFHPLRAKLVVLGLYCAATFWAGFGVSGATTFGIALVMHGVISGSWLTVTASLGQRLLPVEKFAQFASALGIVNSLLIIGVGPCVGALLDHASHDYRLTFFAAGALSAAALGAGLVLHRKFLALGGPRHYVAPD